MFKQSYKLPIRYIIYVFLSTKNKYPLFVAINTKKKNKNRQLTKQEKNIIEREIRNCKTLSNNGKNSTGWGG
jgi:hypothetical protein